MRDEGLLKLFFSGELTPSERLALIRRIRGRHEAIVERLRSIEDKAAAVGGAPHMTLQFGLGQHGWVVDWCKKLEAEIE